MTDKSSQDIDIRTRNKLDEQAIKEAVVAASTSFATGMKILPARKRKAMFAIYAYCRELDDIADGDSPVGTDPTAVKNALLAWKDRINAIYEGYTQDALDRSLLLAIGSYGLKKQDFMDIIDGCLMDAEREFSRKNLSDRASDVAPLPTLTEKELDLYCDRVASAVGRLSMRVFGAPDGTGDKLAYHLGRALQLVNILRDIETDRELGRVYLPSELMNRFKLVATKSNMLRGRPLDDLCRLLAKRAQDHFKAAEDEMKNFRASVTRPARFMAAPYKAVLKGLLKRGWFDPSAPHRSSKRTLALHLARSIAGR